MDKALKRMDGAAAKISALRAAMAEEGLAAYLVPRADEYLGEYVPACAERLSWLTGFTGSAGMAAVLKSRAALFSDGRYALQMKQQADPALYETVVSPPAKPSQWLGQVLEKGDVVGYDPKLVSGDFAAALERELAEGEIVLKPLERNLIDALWADRPGPPRSTVRAFPEAVAGRAASAKRQDVVARIKEDDGFAAVINAPDSIAWMLNIRGGDVPHNPFALSTLIAGADGMADWFIEKDRVPHDVAAGLGNHIRVAPPGELPEALDRLAAKAAAAGRPVLLDDLAVSAWFRQRLEKAGARVLNRVDPCVLPRACKTREEQAAIRDVHARDGAAMARFLCWLDAEAPKGGLDEISVAARLAAFRADDPGVMDSSFDTIAGWAENGAVVHYRATPETCLSIRPPGILLIDSGAQYESGTTDITRTVAVGAPAPETMEHNTRVLKGHVAVASLHFPDGTTGRQVDAFARRALWDAGLDYAHGTGHGVGCALSVHERGIGISPRSDQAFRPGMLVSNEPGYYREGAYGIRIENLILVVEAGLIGDGSARKRYAFETVTLAPFDRRLILAGMLDAGEIGWIDSYHARVLETLAPRLDAETAAWLEKACRPLGDG